MRDEPVQFKAGTHRPAKRFEAVKAWLTEQGFDVNEVPLDALIAVEAGRVTVAVFARDEDGRLLNRQTTQTRDLVSDPSDLVMGVTGS